MALPELPVNQSLREIDRTTWILGDKIVISRNSSTSSSGWQWDGVDGSRYTISETCQPTPPSQPLSSPDFPKLIYDAGDASAVWEMGNAIIKFKILESPKQTREHVTLAALHKKDLTFAIPKVIYHAEFPGRYFIILERLPGNTLHEAWPRMDEQMKQYYVNRVVEVCKELATMEAQYIGGIDGNEIPDRYLLQLGSTRDFSHLNLLQNCKAVGMDCSNFVFFHCDMGPGNILVKPEEKWLGVIDWEVAGFVPKEWMRTKVRVGGGFDFNGGDFDSQVDWRRRVQVRMGESGFSDVVFEWKSWWMKNWKET